MRVYCPDFMPKDDTDLEIPGIAVKQVLKIILEVVEWQPLETG